MIDWHSHILPGIDDGSKNVEESRLLLDSLNKQGVDTVIATPHFYADNDSVDAFLEKRKKAFEKLSLVLPDKSPEILLGAEVRYYPGISRMKDLEKLSIGKTDLLLLEMSMSVWSEYTVRELRELSGMGIVRIILAHVERYLPIQKKGVWEQLLEDDIIMQTNANHFQSILTKRKAIHLLENGMIHIIGSDCHNMTTRPPKLEKAFHFIKDKLGEEFLTRMDEYGHFILGNNN